MPGFAVDATMRDSRDPINSLVVLEDTDGDGVMDKRTVFADKLVLARAFKVLDKGRVLIGEPPNLYLATDTDGDLKADKKELLRSDYGGTGGIEHDVNGLYWGMDNVLYNSEFTYHLKMTKDGKFEKIPTLSRGQWGITQDDAGRIYRDVNTDALFVDIIPDRYFMRNPNVVGTHGLYESITSQEHTQVWPVRPTRGVNRGYRTDEVLRPDGSAYYYQGVSSPMIYRGDRLPKELYGNAFVVDGPTNLVHRLIMTDDNGKLFSHDAYKKGEFLASTDERFRPTALTLGPDGSLYICDMYRGVSQDGPIQTDYLRDYIYAHKLEMPVGLGRIYRVAHTSTKFDTTKPSMYKETPAQLVAHLSHPNGWWRDTAQQLLVQRDDKSVVPAIKQLIAKTAEPRVKMNALWTLDGLDAIDQATVTPLFNDKSADVRATAVRLSERWLREGNAAMQALVLKKMDDPNWAVRRQVAASLGELPASAKVAPLSTILQRYGADEISTDAAVSGLAGQEAEMLEKISGASDPVWIALSGAVGKSRNAANGQKVLDLATDANRPMPVRLALLRGLNAGLGGPVPGRGVQDVFGGRAGAVIPGMAPGGGGGRRGAVASQAMTLAGEPTALTKLAAGSDELATVAKQVVARVTWPGKPAPAATGPRRTADEEARYNVGKEAYEKACVGCHGSEGQGTKVGAPLAGSRWVAAPAAVVSRILMNGKEGSMGLMPPLGGSMTDDQVAAILTYIRGSWGNTAAPIAGPEVRETRRMYVYRKTPWTEAELSAGRGGRGRGGQ
jgi:mono/diheme cytochrome c family protein